jgi:hypothetical protein
VCVSTGTNEFGMIEEARSFEHSGPFLALIRWGSELKQLILYTILADVFLAPWGLASTQHLGSVILAIVALLAKACAVGCVVAVIDNSFAKLRLFKITEFAAGAFLLAVLGVFTLYLGGGGEQGLADRAPPGCPLGARVRDAVGAPKAERRLERRRTFRQAPRAGVRLTRGRPR